MINGFPNGEIANSGEFPHMVALVYGNNTDDETYDVRCGATLISSDYVITAAHCVLNRLNEIPTKVVLGSVDISKNLEEYQSFMRMEIEVESICTHPNYTSLYVYNDIALIRLKTPIRQFTSYVRPACLFNLENIPDDEVLFITGWGAIDPRNRNQSYLLQWARNQYMNLNSCNMTYYQSRPRELPFGLMDSQICTRDTRGSNSSTFCKGDSGGPLQSILMWEQNLFNLIGIMSYGPVICAGEDPVIYTRVSDYLDWIEQIVWPNGSASPDLCKATRTV